jgi:hypothetical protein
MIVALPLEMVVSKFGLKFMLSYYAVLFSVMMWPYLWEIAVLMQQSYVREVMGEGGLEAWTEPNVTMLMYVISDGLFISFPVLFTTVLGMAGLQGAGMIASQGTGVQMGASAGKGAGDKGGSKVQNNAGTATANAGKSMGAVWVKSLRKLVQT